MNQSRMWLLVKPSWGIPLFLGWVSFMSLSVHYALLNNTTWFAAFWGG